MCRWMLSGRSTGVAVTNGDVVKDSAPRSLSVPAKRQITRLREKPIVIAAAALRARALVLGRSNSRGASQLPGDGWKSHYCVSGLVEMWFPPIAFQSLTSRLLVVVTRLYPRDASLVQ